MAEALAGGLVDRVGEAGARGGVLGSPAPPHGRTAVDDVDFDGR